MEATTTQIEALATKAADAFCDYIAAGHTVDQAIAAATEVHPALGRSVALSTGRTIFDQTYDGWRCTLRNAQNQMIGRGRASTKAEALRMAQECAR